MDYKQLMDLWFVWMPVLIIIGVYIKGVIEYSSLQVSYGAKIQGTLRHRGSVQSYSSVTTDEIKEDDVNENQEGDK